MRYYLKMEKDDPDNRFFSISDQHNDVLLTASQYIDNKGNVDEFGLRLKLKEKVENYNESVLEDTVTVIKKAFKELDKNYEKYIEVLIDSLKTMNYDRNNTHIFVCVKNIISIVCGPITAKIKD